MNLIKLLYVLFIVVLCGCNVNDVQSDDSTAYNFSSGYLHDSGIKVNGNILVTSSNDIKLYVDAYDDSTMSHLHIESKYIILNSTTNKTLDCKFYSIVFKVKDYYDAEYTIILYHKFDSVTSLYKAYQIEIMVNSEFLYSFTTSSI